MSKFNFSKLVDRLQKDKRTSGLGVLLGSDIGTVSDNPSDYVVLDTWFKETYGILGVQFGRTVQVAGDSDSGKTTFAMHCIKNAQDQGYGVVYVETENKTPLQYFQTWGIDPEGVILVKSSITELAFDGGFAAIDEFFSDYPDQKLLFVFDSFGNTLSNSDHDNSLLKESRVGGTAKTNRKALSILGAKMIRHPVATVLINYTYDNIGSHGKTNAGGKASNFLSTLTIQTQRVKWLEKTKDNEKIRVGAQVKWTTFKNHYEAALKDVYLPKSVELSLTSEGIKRVDK